MLLIEEMSSGAANFEFYNKNETGIIMNKLRQENIITLNHVYRSRYFDAISKNREVRKDPKQKNPT